jgi:hypothetical protein
LISIQAHLFWVLSWCFSDDEGVMENDPLLLRAQIFPRRTDIRVEQVEQWIDQLVKARYIIPFTHKGESYLLHRTFNIHQKIDRPHPSKIPSPVIRGLIDDDSSNVRPCIVKDSNVKEKEITPDGVADPPEAESSLDIRIVFKELKREKKELVDFIRKNKPDFIEPYVELWNLFAEEKKLAKVSKINSSRKKKFHVRLHEKDFDFIDILKKAKDSQFLLTGKWFGFDWIIENETNYLKVIEGNYDKQAENKSPVFSLPPKVLSKVERQINQRYSEFLENRLKPAWIESEDFQYLVTRGIKFNNFPEIEENVRDYITHENLPNEPNVIEPIAKKFAVIEFFKQQNQKGHATIFRVD